MRLKLLYVISNIDKALAFEWVAQYLDKTKFELIFVLLNPGDSALERFLKVNNFRVYHIDYNGKKDFLRSIYSIYRIIKDNKIKVVHTHLFDANLAGLIAARMAGVSKMIHTRHHGTQHHLYAPKGVYYDRLINYLSTHIIAISESVKRILNEMENVSLRKISVIHHGFRLNEFENIDLDRILNLREKYKVSNNCYPVIGVISRYTHLKGIQFIIPAFQKLLKDYPNAHLILANAKGDFLTEIKNLLKYLPSDNYTEIEFESDLPALYQLFDFFVHVPINKQCEAFGQTYVEALAASIPSVFSLSGIADEFILNEDNALVVDFQNSEAIYAALIRLINNSELRSNLVKKGKADVKQLFELEHYLQKLEKIYLA